ncbi:MAG TPA: sulfurtransferase [Actinomycetota bacterium]|jgi:thiosulfate/3-mercaptopyruvate sulfurtransferase|nr:sulfurtransferase [Actinomycetota bacterium]
MADYAKDVLVSTEWVEEHAGDENIAVVEVDEDTEAYGRGHIPGAIAWNWRTDLQDPIRRDFISKDDLSKLLGKSGISNDTQIVLYGGNNNWFAAYAYWYLQYYGHTNAKLMNGGRKKWELEGRELTPDVPERKPTTYTAKDPNADIRAFRDYILSNADKVNLVDVRSPQEFAGELLAPPHLPQEAAYVPGHIPGAKNIPWSKTVNEDDGEFKAPDELRELYESEGVDLDKETVAYCRIGERSAHTWFVLNELLGVPAVRNYDGSWTEWGSLVGVPVERGA